MMTNSQPVRDRFASPEYCNPNAKLPFIQSLRGENPSECCFFVSLDQMAKASWLNVPETLDSYTFSSGAIERGLLLPPASNASSTKVETASCSHSQR